MPPAFSRLTPDVRSVMNNSPMGQLAPVLQSVARIIFGFLILRHGMEQVLAFPEASHASRMSFEGLLEVLAVPAGVLLIFGLYTRQVSLVLATLYFILFFLGPLQRGPFTHRNGGDPILLNAFFFLYLSAAGAGSLSADRLRGAVAIDKKWTPIALGILRIAAAGLFLMHGLEKIFGVGGGRIDRDIMSLRGLAGYLEILGGSLFGLGLFTRPVAFVLSGEMAVAYFRTWAPRGFWPSFEQAGMEASILF